MARPNLQDYRKLVSYKAQQIWYKLPPQHRVWIDAIDLVQDGMLFASRCVLPRYRPHRAKFDTYLSVSLDNYYKNMLAEMFTAKRNKCSVVPICSILYQLTEQDHTEEAVRARQALVAVIEEASPVLRHYLHRWLFVGGHVHARGARFAMARSELLLLAQKCGLERRDFEYLLTNVHWKRELQPLQKRFFLTRSSVR